MSGTEPDLAPDTTERLNAASFSDWNFDIGLPDEDALQRMCRKAAADAVNDLVEDSWMVLGFRDEDEAPGPKRLNLSVYAWDAAVTLRRPFGELIAELADNHSYGDGEMDDDDEDVLEIISELEAAIALFRGRMRPRGER